MEKTERTERCVLTGMVCFTDLKILGHFGGWFFFANFIIAF